MNSSQPARLADVSNLLEGAEYVVERRKLAGHDCVLGETPYALVACFELENWDQVEEHVFDVQAALTRLAEAEPSARAWDLYVVAMLLTPANEASDRALAESIEADTRYARKFIRVAVLQHDLDRALRPLLPLRSPAHLEVTDPIHELRNELGDLDLSDEVADMALRSFARTNTVEVR